ncbi:NAD-dependent epimerase/dehydratase family protein [Edaphobacter bradus]|uniref:NAD-dependent epimerase/dehydratase family protein n=1 Tax=Edaphobacter bradus TaxID=2259016 RepID=UPI0021DF4FEF|nr:NAD(P)-dependent oxidoreductase [Edaphobacter bradus]
MNVLVTGGAGFIGSHVVRELIQANHTVVAYDIQIESNSLEYVLDEAERSRMSVVTGDVNDAGEFIRILREHNSEAIVHLASPLSSQTESDPALAIRNMVEAHHVVLEAARLANLRKVVWASSVGVYGSPKQYNDLPLPNDAPHYPTSLYGACKSFNEYLSTFYTDKYGIDTLGLRFPLVYGVGRMRGNGMYFVNLVERPALGLPCQVPLADAEYGWLYVVDAASLVAQALCTEKTPTRNFNVAGEFASMRKAVEIIRGWIPDAEFELEPGEYPIVQELDSSKLRNEVGFVPSWSLKKGLHDCLNIVRTRAGLPLLESLEHSSHT